jgi:N-terminal acetyltransferase B complex non-catalytic subunit
MNKQNEYELNENKIRDIDYKIDELNDKYIGLKDYEYDEHCKYCLKNNITKQKLFIENEIKQYHDNKNNITAIQIELNKYIQKHKKIIREKDEYDELIKEKEDSINKINMLNKDNEIKKMELDKLNDKINKMKIMDDNYEKFKNNKNVEMEIENMENKINDIKNMVLKEEEEYNELIKTKNKLNDCAEDLEEETKECVIELSLYTEKKEYYENNINKINLQNTKQEYQEKYDDLQKQMDTINDELKINNCDNDKIILLKQKQYLFDDLNKKCINLKQKKEYYNIIVNILKDNGIINTIMQKILLPKFENIVNNLFTKFNARPIKIEYIKSEIFISGSDGISVVKDGGYLSYLNNIVYRLGLAQLNGYMNTNFMIIDEAFDSADNTNKKNILNLIEYLKTINDWTIVISHDDIIKDKYDSMLYIKQNDNKTKQIVFSR